MHTHRDTKIGPRLGKKPLWETLENIILIRSSSNDTTKESTMIHNFIYVTKQL